MICEYSDVCTFMVHIGNTDTLAAHSVRIAYCGNDKYGCARYGLYQVFEADDVPEYLWPNDEKDALEMIKSGSMAKGRS